MDIEDFVELSLKQIIRGMAKAKSSTNLISAIAPGSVNGKVFDATRDISFELTVIAKEMKDIKGDGKGGGKISLKVLGNSAEVSGGGSLSKSTLDENIITQKVTFKIPINFNADHRDDPNREKENKRIKQALQDMN